MKKLKESYEWIKKPDELPKENLLKVTAKTTARTLHPNDTNGYKVRIFPKKELELAARSLKYKRVGVNHEFDIEDAIVLDSEWNDKEQAVEALLYVPDEYIQKVKDGLIEKVSVEYTWRDELEEDGGIAFYGLNFDSVDLLIGEKAGDKATSIKLFEAELKKGKILGEVQKPKKKLGEGCVWSTKWDSPETCIAANQNKKNPEAYCMSKVGESESKGKEQEEPIPTTQEECEKKSWYWYEDACHKEPKVEEPKEESVEPEPSEEPADASNVKPEPVTLTTKEDCEKCGFHWWNNVCNAEPKPEVTDPSPEATGEELAEALKRVLKENVKLKADFDKKLKEAVDEAKEKVLKIVEGKIPGNMITSRFNFGARRLVCDLKKVIKETRNSS